LKSKLSRAKDNEKHKFELLYPQDLLARRIKEMGQQISDDYEGKNPLFIGVLKGCIVFMADLIRHIAVPMEIDFISASRYIDGQPPRDKVELAGQPNLRLTGRHILIVEGVVDSGITARAILENLRSQEPASIEIVTLLDKKKCRKVPVDIKYAGFNAGDNYVIGYGLDMDQKYRNLAFIGRVLNE